MKLTNTANQFHIDQPLHLSELAATDITTSEISILVARLNLEVHTSDWIVEVCKSALHFKLLFPEYFGLIGLTPEYLKSRAANALSQDQFRIIGYGEMLFPRQVKYAFDLNELWDKWWEILQDPQYTLVNPEVDLACLLMIFPQHRDELETHMHRIDYNMTNISELLGDGGWVSSYVHSLIMVGILDRNRLKRLKGDLRTALKEELEEYRQTSEYQKIVGCALMTKLLNAKKVTLSEHGVDIIPQNENDIPNLVIY